jgi:hypothetical protein
MSNLLKPVWDEVEKLLSAGISVIPVRDKDEFTQDGRKLPAKSPYIKWEQYQTERIKIESLWAVMEKMNTTAIATICGNVSGNLEAIDIDVKNKPGIATSIFNDIKSLYPNIYEKLRIHQTPSNGYHIPYRISDHEVPGNLKIAGRPSTEDELKLKKEKVKYFVETRGTGGYVLAPPSLNYSIAVDKPYPLLTWEERCCLITICENYHEIVKQEPSYKPTKSELQYYDKNPFDDFNNRCNPSEVLAEFGYVEVKHNNRFIWYTRPGGTKGNIHISFNLERRFYKNFSANSDLEEKGYTPSNLVSTLKFNGDKKKLYAYLVEKGYGKVKPKIEAEQTKKRVIAGQPLPANFSTEAQQQAQHQQAQLSELHPFGIFWEVDEEDKVLISREGVYQVSEGLGYRLYNDELVQIDTYKLHRRTDRYFYDTLKSYIHEEDADLYEDICNSYEAFIQKNGTFTISRLPILSDTIISDTKSTCYKFFENCFIEITSTSIITHDYSTITGIVWSDKIQSRSYVHCEPKGKYVDFLQKATNLTYNVKKAIGYLTHEFKDETIGYIIVLAEECPDPKMGGGSGKNIFSDLLQYSTTYDSTAGSQVKFDEKFLQSWNYERIYCLSDVNKGFDFLFLKNLSTGKGKRKALFKNEVNIPVEMMPKFIISTNYSYEIKDGGLRRRIIPIEFTNFFTNTGGVKNYYKDVHFPKGWNDEDWQGYDALIVECIQLWIKSGLQLDNSELSTGGWLKQFEQSYGQLTREFIEEHFEGWKNEEKEYFISNKTFNDQYEKFCVENGIQNKYRLSSQLMNRALHTWSEQHDTVFTANEVKTKGGFSERGRLFMPNAPF